MLKLYYAPGTISAAVAIALNEGVHWEAIRVDFASGEQTKPEYHKLNPKGRVPVLITPQGALTETGAILEYIGETLVPALVPVDPLARARMREVMYYLATTMHVSHAHGMRGYRWAVLESSFEDMRKKAQQNMTDSAAYIETQIEGPFLFGPEPTLADCYLYPIACWLENDGVDTSLFPKLIAWRLRMKERASVTKAHDAGFLN